MKVKGEEIVEFITQYQRSSGYPPTVRDIAKNFNISVSTAYEYLTCLRQNNTLFFKDGQSRTIHLLPKKDFLLELKIPVLGEVRAGRPVWAEENLLEYLGIPYTDSARKELYALRVLGDSMQDVGIVEGDWVVVKKKSTAKDKDIVIALIDSEVTLKRFIKKGKKSFLKAENPKYALIELKADAKILGQVVSLIRAYG